MEGQGVRDTLRQMRPDRLEDLIAAVALYRPGPMANIPDYCRRKHGEKWEAPHPVIHDILAETYGIMVYQEQVMQIAQTMAGYSLGSADLLRRAMGKKIASEMEAQRDIFTRGAIERGIEPAKAKEVFDLMAKFADYGFNKSHAAAYGLVAYQTAWLKANHPEVFIAACMSSRDQQHRPARRVKAGSGIGRPQDPSAGHQPFRRGFLRRTAGGRRAGDPLCSGRRETGWPRRDGSRGGGAGRHAVRRPRGFRRPDRPAATQPGPGGKPRPGGCVRPAGAEPRPAVCRGRNDHPPGPVSAGGKGKRADRIVWRCREPAGAAAATRYARLGPAGAPLVRGRGDRLSSDGAPA